MASPKRRHPHCCKRVSHYEVAIDPEMLGRIFEAVVLQEEASQSGGQSLRYDTGSHYTPRPIVHHLSREGLAAWLESQPPFVGQAFQLAGSGDFPVASSAVPAGWSAPQPHRAGKPAEPADRNVCPTPARQRIDALLRLDASEGIDEPTRAELDRLLELRACDAAVGSGAFPMGLTALGLSMFLAALKLADSNPVAPDPLRLLVLDDVLIGLDLSNRLPLIECLRVEFPHHQTILLTYDGLWFNIAREHTAHWGHWRSAQMFAELTGPADPSIPRLKDTTDDLAVATRYLNTNDLRSAAVYVRAAFENRLRTICEDKHVKLDFKQDPKKVSADALCTAILARQKDMAANGKAFADPNLVPGIEAIRSQVLNRLAHDGGIGLTRQTSRLPFTRRCPSDSIQ